MDDIKFVIDTGASITISMQRMALGLNLNSTPVKLSAASGKEIECFGEAVIDFGILGLRRSYTWTVVVTDTSTTS